MAPRVGDRQVTIVGVTAGEVEYAITCLECGGYEQKARGQPGVMGMIHCAACGVWFGRKAALDFRAAMQAKGEGFDIDPRRYTVSPPRRTQP